MAEQYHPAEFPFQIKLHYICAIIDSEKDLNFFPKNPITDLDRLLVNKLIMMCTCFVIYGPGVFGILITPLSIIYCFFLNIGLPYYSIK